MMGRAVVVLLWWWIWAANADYTIYQDPKQAVGRRVKDLLSRMSLQEKIGQMTQIDRLVASAHVLNKYYIGSVLSGGGSVPSRTASPETWVDMVNAFQKGSLSTRLKIPMIYGIDAVHGHNAVYRATVFPHNVGIGATRDPQLVKRIGAATALEVRATGIPYVFAPCVAVCRDPRWGRCFESYSEDPKVVREMTQIIPGLQGQIPPNSPKGVPFVAGQQKVVACAKHYVGDGGTTRGINENNTVASRHDLLSIHMAPYYNAVIKGVGSIMISYTSWNGVKMHANRDLITGFLKNTLRFRGFVISDWQGIDRITSPPHLNYTYSILAGVGAGIDMIMVPYDYKEFIDGLTSLVKRKFIPMSRIDDAVARILRVKFTMGLFEHPLADYSMAKYLGSQEHRELAREAVRKSLVLLKNGESADEPLIPLPKKAAKILVAGTHADNIGYQCGGWTIEWQGLSGNITAGTTILSAIKNTVSPKTRVVFKENPDSAYVKANKFSYAIVVVGEPPYAETFGDSTNLTLPDPGPSIIMNVCASVRCVVVLVTGRPVVIQPYLDHMDALVAAWLPGTEGQGVADVLFGDYGFSGKLSRTWFKTVDQLPMNVGDRHYDPLFPFGSAQNRSPPPPAASAAACCCHQPTAAAEPRRRPPPCPPPVRRFRFAAFFTTPAGNHHRIMSTSRGLLGFGRRYGVNAPEATADTSDGSGTHISGTPETPNASSSSRARRPRGPTAAAIREREVKAPDGRTVFQRHPETGVLLEPTGLSKACTCTFKMFENPGGYTWKLTPPAMKDKFFDELQKEFTWQPDDEHDVRIMWETKARKRYSDMMSDYKTTLKQCISQGREMSRPAWMTPDFWTGLRDYWHQPEVEAVSTRARANRMSEPDGEGTGISRHVGGSQSTRILQQYMSLDPGTPQDAPNYATFLRLHTYADGSYTSERDARIDAEVHRLAAATGRQERLDEVYLEVVQIDRSRIYGVGSAGQSQASRGSIRSTGSSAVSQQLYETRISTLEEQLAAEQAQRQQMEDRMAQLEAFMRMYNAQPPPGPDADDDDDDA